MWKRRQRGDRRQQKEEVTGIPDHHQGIRLEMILGEVCVFVAAEGRRGGVAYDRCAAPILYLEVYKAKEFILTANQVQRYEFYRKAFGPMEKLLRCPKQMRRAYKSTRRIADQPSQKGANMETPRRRQPQAK